MIEGERLQAEIVTRLSTDRVLAHEVLFSHRHPVASCPAHHQVIEAFHSKHARVVVEAFRGFSKSTQAEEAVLLGALLEEFDNCLLIGASYDRACERLESIKHELETNEKLIEIFGAQRSGKDWASDKIVLQNGCCIQAKGAGQSLRGVKHYDKRPGYIVIDDLEDEESVKTPAARREMLRWLFKTLMPALAPGARVRFIGNRLDPEAVIVKIAQDKSWKHLRFPVYYLDPASGEQTPTWPGLFPMAKIREIRDEFIRQGLFEDFNQEYMCEADTPEERIFRPEHFAAIVSPIVRTWEPAYVMVDPAKSVGKRSATTAMPVWSWVQNRMRVWECPIGYWLPDEIVAKIFELDEKYHPVLIGVEEDSLNQFLMQPLRQAQMKHGRLLPLKPFAARRFTEGRGKEDFIKALQPFFAAREVVFNEPMPLLQQQFLSFPKGVIDGPNALAYAPRLRPGMPIYDDFSAGHVSSDLLFSTGRSVYLAMNASKTLVSGILCQYDGLRLAIVADWIEEGDPGQVAGALWRQARLRAKGLPVTAVVGPKHFEQWSNVGLNAALRRVQVEATRGGDPEKGREHVREMLRRQSRGLPAILVSNEARWTLNGFAGGYVRAPAKGGVFAQEAEEGVYKLIMEGLESLASLLEVEAGQAEDAELNYRTTADGRRYLSAMPNRG